MGTIIKELNNLKKSFEISEKERNEAVTKLQVLADYFNNEKTKIHKYGYVFYLWLLSSENVRNEIVFAFL